MAENNNFLQPSGFTISISRENYPKLEFFAQAVSHPSVDVAATDMSVRRARIPYAGDTVQFGPLDITFLVDENMESYIEMFDWMRRLVNQNQTPVGDDSNIPTEADIIVSVLTSHNNPNRRIKYYNCVPESVTGIELNTQSGAEIPLTFNVSFRCTAFEID